jgi:hypothetical protein
MAEQLVSDLTLDQVEAAAFLGLTPRTLESWRAQKRGPKYLSYSKRCVRYRLRDLLSFQESRAVSTGATG